MSWAIERVASSYFLCVLYICTDFKIFKLEFLEYKGLILVQ